MASSINSSMAGSIPIAEQLWEAVIIILALGFLAYVVLWLHKNKMI